MNDEELRGLLSGMRDDPVPADSLVKMRARVAERTRGRVFPRWAVGPAAVAACLCLSMFLLRDPVRVERLKSPVARPKPAAAARVPGTRPARGAAETVRRARHAAPRQKNPRREAQVPDTTVIRIETADPNVVILLIGD